MSTPDTTTTTKQQAKSPQQPQTESKLNPDNGSNSNDNETKNSDETLLTLSSIILPITDNDFENVDISLHGPVLIFNELLKNEDTSQWYFLEKVHENYFPTKQKWTSYLSKISPNEPIDFHDIRNQIINGYYNKSDTKKLLNDIGSIFTNAMIRYDEDDDNDNDNDNSEDGEDSENNTMYDESQRLLTKFQTLCSEMDKDTSHNHECEDNKEEHDDDIDAPVIIPSSDDVFEIEDYYCASPWETLISEIEKQLQAWNLHNGANQCAIEYRQQMKNNCILSCNITVNNSDYNYILQYHDYTDFIGNKTKKQHNTNYTVSMNEMMNTHRDISDTDTHEICLWFGISRFILLLPGNNNIDFIDESECMFMFSTLCIACFNIECNLSYFVPFGDQWDMSFRGGLKYNRYNIEYICKSQRQIPTLCQYLDGIFKVFKRHLRLYYDETDPMLQMMSSTTNPLYKIYANVRYKYIYDPSTNILALLNHNWRDFIADDKISYGIRWGPTYSPLKSLSLYTIWTYFPQGAFMDNLAHTDLDPYNAPKWCINGVWSELSTKKLQSESHTPLTNSLYNLFVIARDLVEDNDIVWRDIISSNAIKQQDIKQIYAIKQQSYDTDNTDITSNHKLMSPADSKHPLFEDFIKQNVLKNDLYFDDNDRKQMEDIDSKMNGDWEYFIKGKMLKSPSPPVSSPKCVPFGSLLSIFVLRLFEIEDIDIGHIGDVWYKLTYEVSNRWTDCKLLPGIYGLPDFRTCLLQQKLQLLNECIRRKLQQREYIIFKAMKLSKLNGNENIEIQAQGVEKKHPFLYLINDADIAINIPLTQDHPIFTADKLEEHYEELVSLGSSMDASKQRAELQSKQLKSDMMAFKAANPKCMLEDFIRWYSPNDWIVEDNDEDMDGMNGDVMSHQKQSSPSQEIIYFDSDDSNDDDIVSSDSLQNGIKLSPTKKEKQKESNSKQDLVPKKGHLSTRMTAKNNIWSRIWTESECIPAMEQELLFDFDIEGNEALKWIMNLQPTDTLLQICQIGIGNCISILKRTPGVDQQLIPLIDMIKSLIKSTKKIWKLNKKTNENYLDIDNGIKIWMKELRLAEMGCACGAALTFKFNTRFCKDMIEKLMMMPYQAQITTIKEKEAVLSIIGQRIYDDDDEYDEDSSEADEEGKENTGFWSWGSSPTDKDKSNKNKKYNEDNRNRKESIVIYDEEVNNSKSNSELSSTTNKNRKGRRYELPKPSSKQYTVLASAPRPHPDSQPTPNRMHVTIDQYGFKMALATSTIE